MYIMGFWATIGQTFPRFKAASLASSRRRQERIDRFPRTLAVLAPGLGLGLGPVLGPDPDPYPDLVLVLVLVLVHPSALKSELDDAEIGYDYS